MSFPEDLKERFNLLKDNKGKIDLTRTCHYDSLREVIVAVTQKPLQEKKQKRQISELVLQSTVMRHLKLEKRTTRRLLADHLQKALSITVEMEFLGQTLDKLADLQYITLTPELIEYLP